jgi:predicted metal-dependent hydrolase
MGEILKVGDLAVAVRRSSRRSTLDLTVERDGSLTLAAPVDCPTERIESFVHERRSWVYRKLARKEMLTREVAPKEYVSGESFPYLGRNYRLRLVEPATQEVPLRLHHGWFLLRRDSIEEAKEHFVQWYSRLALPWLSRRVALLGPRVGARPDHV